MSLSVFLPHPPPSSLPPSSLLPPPSSLPARGVSTATAMLDTTIIPSPTEGQVGARGLWVTLSASFPGAGKRAGRRSWAQRRNTAALWASRCKGYRMSACQYRRLIVDTGVGAVAGPWRGRAALSDGRRLAGASRHVVAALQSATGSLIPGPGLSLLPLTDSVAASRLVSSRLRPSTLVILPSTRRRRFFSGGSWAKRSHRQLLELRGVWTVSTLDSRTNTRTHARTLTVTHRCTGDVEIRHGKNPNRPEKIPTPKCDGNISYWLPVWRMTVRGDVAGAAKERCLVGGCLRRVAAKLPGRGEALLQLRRWRKTPTNELTLTRSGHSAKKTAWACRRTLNINFTRKQKLHDHDVWKSNDWRSLMGWKSNDLR